MTLSKGRDGWNAQDYIELGSEEIIDIGKPVTAQNRIRISTYKTRGGLRTTAAFVRKIPSSSAGVFFEQHRVFQDYSKTIISSTSRCTERAVREQQAEAMAKSDIIRELVLAHQAEADLKRAA